MTARIDLAELEQRARSIQTIFAGCETNGSVRVHAADVLALIAAVRALRDVRRMGRPSLACVDPMADSECVSGCDPEADCPVAKEAFDRATAALAAFDFKEETK